MAFAAKQGDDVKGMDTHLVAPVSGGPPAPVQLPFNGKLTQGLSATVKINGKPAAVVGSAARNTPSHIQPPGMTFLTPPRNVAQISRGSQTVRIDGKPAARAGDAAMTCNDPVDAPQGTVIASGSVNIG